MPAFTFGPKAAPPAPVVTARAKRMVIDITPSSDNERVSCEVRRYASATDAANDEQLITGIGGSPYLTGGGQYLRTPATYQKRWADVVELRVTDHDDLTDGTEYFYAIFETDEFGNRSLTSATDSAVYRLVDTDDIAEAAVTDVELAPESVIPSKRFPDDTTNLWHDSEMLEATSLTFGAGISGIERVANDDADYALGGSRFMAKATKTTSALVEVEGPINIPCADTAMLFVSAYLGTQPNRLLIVTDYSVGIRVDFYQVDATGAPTVFISSETISDVFIQSGRLNGQITPPSGAQVARMVFQLDTVATGGYFYIASPEVRRVQPEAEILDTIYTRSRILGTVSQSGGVPTGAIIEHGSNSNGYYTKFADGTMICRFVDGGTLDSNTASGSGFVSSASGTWTFPEAFINTNDTVVTGQVNGLNRWVSFGAPGTTSVLYRHNSFVTSSSGVVTRLQAVGRWF